MPVWPFLWGLCAILLAWSLVKRDRAAAWALGCMLGAYVLTRMAVLAFADVNLVVAIIWSVAIGASWRQSRHNLKVFHTLAALIVPCYLFAERLVVPAVVGSLPYVVADCLAIFAMIGAGTHIGRHKPNIRHARRGILGWSYDRRGNFARDDLANAYQGDGVCDMVDHSGKINKASG